MAKKVHKDPKELHEAWKTRMRKINATIPSTFKQFCYQCQQVSVMYINLLVYNAAKSNARTGTLKRSEKLVRASAIEYILINDAKTMSKFRYANAIHEGRKAMQAPTRRGAKAFAWLKNKSQKRPGSQDGKAWRSLVKAKKAVVTEKVKATRPKRWRKRMVATQRGKFAKLYSTKLLEIFRR